MDDLLNIAFDDFDESRPDAALQYSLNALIHNRQLDDLLELLDMTTEVGAVGGDPGWVIEKRKPIDTSADWPSWAAFHVFLDPDAFTTASPDCYYSEDRFSACLRRLLSVYAKIDRSLAELMPKFDVLLK